MRKKLFTITSLLLIMLVAHTSAIKAEQVMHLIVMNQDSIEQASFEVETIDDLIPNNDIVNVKVTIDEQTKQYQYERETSLFKYALRDKGTATANENISTTKWSICYNSGNLHITNPVGPISIYKISGVLIGSYPESSDVSIYLQPDIYIVKNGPNAAKLLVNNHNAGTIQVEEKNTIESNSSPKPVSLTTKSTISSTQYWNVSNGKTTIPVDINMVHVFKFTSENTLLIEYINGNTTEITGYNGGFSIAKVPDEDYWDWTLTSRLGGASYGCNFDYLDAYKVEYISIFSKTHLIIYDIQLKKETRYPINSIHHPESLNKTNAIVSILNDKLCISYNIVDEWDMERIYFLGLFNGGEWGEPTWASIPVRYYEFNNWTNRIHSTIKMNENGDLVVSYKNADGVAREYTIKR